MKRRNSNKFAVPNTTAVALITKKTASVEKTKAESAPVVKTPPTAEAAVSKVKETKPASKEKPDVQKNDISPIRAIILARLKSGYLKPITGYL